MKLGFGASIVIVVVQMLGMKLVISIIAVTVLQARQFISIVTVFDTLNVVESNIVVVVSHSGVTPLKILDDSSYVTASSTWPDM